MAKAKSKSSLTKADGYLAFIKTVHLSGLGMDDASFSIDRSAFADAFPRSEKPTAEISGRHEIVSRSADSFVVLGHYRVSVKSRKGTEVVQVSCTYSAIFSLGEKAENEYVERFAENEVRLVFWPYVRHFISDSTYRMSISPLVLPLTSEVSE